MVSPLLTAEDLAAALRTDPPVLLDVRWSLTGPPGAQEFAAGHIPGAVFVDLDRELAAPPGPGRHPLPDAGDFEAAMRRHGVSAARRVVVYDGGDLMGAGRCWWLLRHFGHPDVRVLNGGYPAWIRSGGAVSAERREPSPGDFTAGPGRLPVVDADGAEAVADHGALLDVRAATRYRGELEPIDPVAGHIPGALNLPLTEMLAPDGGLRDSAQLRELLDAAGASGASRVAVYCGSGVAAAAAVLALETAGVEAALYPGSWSEWVSDGDRPVARGRSERTERRKKA